MHDQAGHDWEFVVPDGDLNGLALGGRGEVGVYRVPLTRSARRDPAESRVDRWYDVPLVKYFVTEVVDGKGRLQQIYIWLLHMEYCTMDDTDQASTHDQSRKDIRMQTVRKELDDDLTCEMPQSEDPDDVCGNGQDIENGIIVAEPLGSDTATCNRCLEDWYEDEENTFLAERESQVVALKMLGRSHSQIADLLQNRYGEHSPKQATVSSHSRRAREKYHRALRTVVELEPLYDQRGPLDEGEDEAEAEEEEPGDENGTEIESEA